jgi:hypothetical protein
MLRVDAIRHTADCYAVQVARLTTTMPPDVVYGFILRRRSDG